ncbi:MAG: M28 family peptidase [Candidatus Lokiarchaeota archaeon]|nr:M28 family peptidase [Candidatus Lokiarchaeota archaeon]
MSVDNSYIGYITEFITTINSEIGSREPGSGKEKQFAEIIENELKKYCNGTKIESFKFTIAFLTFLKIMVLAFIISIIFYWFSPLVSIIIISFTWLVIYLEFFRYKEFIDPVFRKKESQNVIGVINPKSMDDVKNVLIVSAHHDTAYQYRFMIRNEDRSLILIWVGILTSFFPLSISILKYIFTGYQFFTLPNILDINLIFFILGLIISSLIPLYVLIYKFFSFRPVLKVVDDVVGVATCLAFAKYLHEHKDDEFYPKKTQIKILSYGAEEAGLRGSKQYIKDHLGEISQFETVNLNLHLTNGENLLLIKEEKSLNALHSMEIIEQINRLENNQDFKTVNLRFGGTSAAVFSKNKIKAITIANSKLSAFPDILKNINEESLKNLLQFLLNYLKYFDS